MNSIRLVLLKLDLLIAAIAFPAAHLFKIVRRTGLQHLPITRKMLLKVGVLPILDHYLEPWFHPRHLKLSVGAPRNLPGIEWNGESQVAWLKDMRFGEELKSVPTYGTAAVGSQYERGNPSYGNGDAEILYAVIRRYKPAQIVEIGSGNSTLMAMVAVKANVKQDPSYQCKMTCIEPYQMPWLEKTGIHIIREKLEDVSPEIYSGLESGDILFIDSSHMIRPQGDVLMEYLSILPTLKSGVLIHIHDIFTPRDYPTPWLFEEIRLWNEQYLLEAFLSCNRDFEILGALNWLKHDHFTEIKAACPWLTEKCEPGSIWLRRK